LKKNESLYPWSDKHLKVGSGFVGQIHNCISHSHIFVPLVTEASQAAGWVHQEIGIAVAMNVTPVPVCIGELPAGMLQMEHAIVEKKSFKKCLRRLSAINFDHIVEQAGAVSSTFGELAHEPGKRARLIAEYSDAARLTIGPQCARHSGGLSSFALPDEAKHHVAWKSRYGNRPRGEEMYEYFRRERQSLEKHAREKGCKLMINYGVNLDREYGEGVWRTRLQILVNFLESLPDDKVEIALFTDRKPNARLMVGDWFQAESMAVAPVSGIQNTFFSSHAPTIRRSIQEFDHELNGYIERQGSNPGKSRTWAIDKLREKIQTLPRHPLWP
jgi:hypothetical protein